MFSGTQFSACIKTKFTPRSLSTHLTSTLDKLSYNLYFKTRFNLTITYKTIAKISSYVWILLSAFQFSHLEKMPSH